MKRAVIAVTAILGAVGILFGLWKTGRLLPDWVVFHEKEEAVSETGILSLNNRKLVYRNGDELLYETPKSWYVSDFLTDDFDEDGKTEVLFLVWRLGNYGASHPFWEEPDTDSFYQHLYIFEVSETGLQRQWMSSALKPMFREWDIRNHRLTVIDPYGEFSVWKWDGFGVERTEEETGNRMQ